MPSSKRKPVVSASCATCRHCQTLDEAQGHCRRDPPRVVYAPVNPERPFVTMFPTVRLDMACGEYARA